MHVPRLQDLLADVLDVLEAVLAGDVVDEDVGGGVAEAVAAEVCPLVERADRKVRDVGAVDDAHFVQVLVDDHSWAEHLHDPLYKVSRLLFKKKKRSFLPLGARKESYIRTRHCL